MIRIRLFGLLTILTIEVVALKPLALEPEKEKVFVKVADNELNRESPFWRERIGDKALWLGKTGTEAAGDKTFCSLQFPEQALPQEDVDVRRLESVPT